MLVLTLLACARTAPSLGMLPCPDRPNCVHSLAPPSSDAHVAPIQLIGSSHWESLDAAIRAMPRVTPGRAEPTYRHYQFQTALLRFTDDVELRLDPETARVDIRSASRVGHSDLGVNRRRVEEIRAAAAALPQE